MDKKLINWKPKPGIFLCALKEGRIFIDMFYDGREPSSVEIIPGQHIELREKELRSLSRSSILEKGYLYPYKVFEKDGEGNEIEVDPEVDEQNPNFISNFHIEKYCKSFKKTSQLEKHIKNINSILTLERYLDVIKEIDPPASFLQILEDAITRQKESELEKEFKGTGPIDERRKKFLYGPEPSK